MIQWPRAKYWDKPWNPIVGCKPCSPACENCYARTAMVDRFGQSFEPHETKQQNPPEKGVVFCGNMTDLWGEFVDGASDYLLQTAEGEGTAYLYLTKRVGRMCDRLNDTLGFLDEEGNVYFRHYCDFGMGNHYFGYTAETQEWFDRRQEESLRLPRWANLWYSLEPLLGPIQMGAGLVRSSLRWVVVGCESGPHRRPCKVEWVESIVERCFSAGVPCFVKQLDLGGKCVTDIDRFPEHLRVRQVPWVGEEVEAV